uniref:Zinc finger CCHC-type containing 3 n=1 Tax=Astyanax mexicanus TaxID=7994 RepID=A0A3B1JQY7_ASTMX
MRWSAILGAVFTSWTIMAAHASVERYARYWAKLKYVGSGDPPDRNTVGNMILDSDWITVQDLLSFIALPNRKEFEVCFNNERGLKIFMDYFSGNLTKWKNFEMFTPTNLEVKNIFVKLWTGRICDQDVETYLKRFCDILKPVVKPVDNLGIWYGVRKYTVKVKRDSSGKLLPIPNAFSLGPFNGKIFYQGQVQSCFICQSPNHQAKDCSTSKCWHCGTTGHKSAECNNTEVCSLCGAKEHNYFQCPSSYVNRLKKMFKPTATNENAQQSEQTQPTNQAENKDKDNEQQRAEDTHQQLPEDVPLPESSRESSGDSSTGSGSSNQTSAVEMEGNEEESYESATEEEFSSDSLTPDAKKTMDFSRSQSSRDGRGTRAAPGNIIDGKRKMDSSSGSEGTRTVLAAPKARKKKP